MKKIILLSAIISSFSGMAMAEAGGSPSTATAYWIGYSQIIPGSLHTITGENGNMSLVDGELNLQADGTFTSTPVIMESHLVSHKGGAKGEGPMIIGDKIDSNWTLDTVTFDWGPENASATAGINITVTDSISGTPLDKTVPLTADRVGLTVTNTTALVDVVNPAAEGKVTATVVSSYIAAS